MRRRRFQARGLLPRRTAGPLGLRRARSRPQTGMRHRPARPRSGRGEVVPRAEGGPGGVWVAASILTALGIVMIYSTTAPLAIGRAVPRHLVQHLLALGIGLAAIALALRTPLAVWRRLALPLWGASIALLAATLAIGIEVNGARRWLPVPGISLRFQPAELARFATLLAVASVLARRGASLQGMRQALALTAAPGLLLLAQPDFGSTALLLVACAALLFAVGTPILHLGALGAAAAAGTAAYVALKPYAAARFTGFLDPWQTANDEGFQLVQSFIAFSRGGTLGVGLGDGRQKLFYLPEAHTDFMLSVVAEELGLVGVLVVLGAFAALAVAGIRIALRSRDPYVMLVGFGMTVLLALPAAVNAAVVMGLLPTKGFPLPFVSYGGNSLVVCSLAVGILLRIAAHEATPEPARVRPAVPRGWVRS